MLKGFARMSRDPRVADLLERWEELCEKGQELSAGELCKEHPELTDAVDQEIKALRAMNWMKGPEPSPPARVLPQSPPGGFGDWMKRIGDVWIELPKAWQRVVPSSPDGPSNRVGAEPVPGYRLEKRLGSGGYGEVWKATGPGGFGVALKFVAAKGKVGEVERRSLEIIKHLRHPNLVTPFASWEVSDWLIIGMELADGTLADRLERERIAGRSGLQSEELREFLREAAKGLDYLNRPSTAWDGKLRQGIQHRDVKPQNLLVFGSGVKIGDFGLVRPVAGPATGHTGSMTAAYAAPEFFDRRTSQHSDQYSLAVSYCELRGGRLPFEGSLLDQMRGHTQGSPDLTMLPPDEQPVVERALSKEPTNRWPSCLTFVQAFPPISS
jgi:serine/threonine protein kinase